MMKTLADPAVLEEILARIRKLGPSSPRAFGKMTPGGMVCHLADSYMVALGERHASRKSRWIDRTLVKWAALRLPVKWPSGVPTRPEMEQGAGGTPPGEFEVDRRRLLELVDRFSECRILAREEHPVFGRMSQDEWLRWGYLHADHHLCQFGC